jgi:hypothetical protein
VKIDIPESVSSLEDLAELLRELRLYTRWFLHESIKKQVDAGSRAPIPELSPASKALLQTLEKDGKLNSRGLENLVKTIESFQKNASPVVITLAAPATTGIKTMIVDWCRKNISGDVLVSFHHDSSILGGIVIRNKSRVVDLSFRRKLFESDVNFVEVLGRV